MKPIDVLGVEVKNSDVDSLVRRQLTNGNPWADRDDMDNATGLLRAVRALAGSPLQKEFIEAALKHITDPNIEVRTGALEVAQSFGGEVGAGPRLLQAWREHPELYRDVPVKLAQRDLERLLYSAIAAAAKPVDSAVIEFLHQRARDPRTRDSVLAGLASVDPNWMVDHVNEWLGDNGQRLLAVLGNVQDEAKVDRVVQAIAKSSADVRASAAEAIRWYVGDRNRAAHLISLLG